jgi:ABC-type lipoprotein release transport system permease subunit
VPTEERLANFHRVENTYLSTFQMLGGLGLILGTLGMAAVLLRNVLERRRELALLRAVGLRLQTLRDHGACGKHVPFDFAAW